MEKPASIFRVRANNYVSKDGIILFWLKINLVNLILKIIITIFLSIDVKEIKAGDIVALQGLK